MTVSVSVIVSGVCWQVAVRHPCWWACSWLRLLVHGVCSFAGASISIVCQSEVLRCLKFADSCLTVGNWLH